MNTNDSVKVNRTYKDRLFRFIFGSEENKGYLLDLYNTLNQSNYTEINDMEITTLEDVIYIKQKNDISFLFDCEINLYEQQSSYNPNMPLRGMLYFSDLYRQYLSKNQTDLYSSTIVDIPTPKYIVFYNGTKDYPDKVELRLSDAFQKPSEDGLYEWTATMLNINYDHNETILKHCTPLREYADFIRRIREYKSTLPFKDAIDKAMNEVIELEYLNGFFRKHRAEVLNMNLTEYNEAEFIENRRAEGRVEGRAEGMEKGISGIIKLCQSMGLDKQMTLQKIIETMDMTQKEAQKYIDKLWN